MLNVARSPPIIDFDDRQPEITIRLHRSARLYTAVHSWVHPENCKLWHFIHIISYFSAQSRCILLLPDKKPMDCLIETLFLLSLLWTHDLHFLPHNEIKHQRKYLFSTLKSFPDVTADQQNKYSGFIYEHLFQIGGNLEVRVQTNILPVFRLCCDCSGSGVGFVFVWPGDLC